MSPRPRTASDDEILDAAADLVLDGGTAAATLAAVGRQVGLAPPTLVERWSGRDGLLAALAAREADRANLALRAALGAPEPPRLQRLIGALGTTADPHHSSRPYRILSRLGADPGLGAPTMAFRRGAHWIVRATLETAVTEGEVRPCDTEQLARILLAITGAALTAPADDAGDLERDLSAVLEPHRVIGSEPAPTSRAASRLRNARGQHTTPASLADGMARAALAQLDEIDPGAQVRFLDPSVGAGALFAAVLRAAPDRIASAVGVEVDPRLADAAQEIWEDRGLEVIRADFTRLAPGHANLILANPPYVRHHALGTAEKRRLRRLARDRAGVDPGGLAGLHVYMLLACAPWLDERGVAAFLLPTEWTLAAHGEALRRHLTGSVTLLRIHAFDAARSRFRDAAASSCIVFFRGAPPPHGHRVEVTAGPDLEHLETRRIIAVEELGTGSWGPALAGSASRAAPVRRAPSIGDLFDIRRGISTGANRYFIRSTCEWHALGIPERHLVPILPPPRRLSTDVVLSDDHGRPLNIPHLALLDCRLAPERVRLDEPELWAYLTSAEAENARATRTARSRTPWFAQERRRTPAPILVAYMGRSRSGGAPLRVISNASRATAPNTYLMLWPKGEVAERVRREPDLWPRLADAIREVLREHDDGHVRAYGDGLRKIEPRELAALPATRVIDVLRSG